jgi:Lar family restriction alleviation protein
MSTEPELKPCPFCGGTQIGESTNKEHTQQKGIVFESYYVFCNNCVGEVRSLKSLENAREKWNTRHEPVGHCKDCRFAHMISQYDTPSIDQYYLACMHEDSCEMPITENDYCSRFELSMKSKQCNLCKFPYGENNNCCDFYDTDHVHDNHCSKFEPKETKIRTIKQIEVAEISDFQSKGE